MIVLTGTFFSMPAQLLWPVQEEAQLCLANYNTSSTWKPKYMPVHSQYLTQTKSLPMYQLSYEDELQSLSQSDMPGISKAATHAVSHLKWTPRGGESLDVITRLLCHSGTILDSQILVLFFLLAADVLSKPSSDAPPCQPPV